MTEQQSIATPAELAEALVASPALLPELVQSLNDTEAAELVQALKSEADRHWWINANQSLIFADLIVQIGQLRGDTWQLALGTMARGDALKFVGNIHEAWELLARAGDLFASVGDDVGWARTRIGRLVICTDLQRVPEALADAERARAIFIQHHTHEKLLILDLNTAIVYNLLGKQHQAVRLYEHVLELATALGGNSLRYLRLAHNCLGNAYNALGDFRQAIAHYELAYQLFLEHHEHRAAAIAQLNLAHIAIAQGNYRRALCMLHQARDLLRAEQLQLDATNVERDMIECYLALNRYAEARDLARSIASIYRTTGSAYREGVTLVHLASAEAGLNNPAAALDALHTADTIFAALGAHTWQATTQLRRGKIALAQGATDAAEPLIQTATTYFTQHCEQMQAASATLLRAEVHLRKHETSLAQQAAAHSLAIARTNNAAALRYSAHVLLGRIAESRQQRGRAVQHYRAAATIVERIERGLSITLRPDFLDDKSDGFRALMRLQLEANQAASAFETLERTKSLTWLSYLANRDQLRWAADSPQTHALLAALNQLREEHQWYYRLAYAPETELEQQTQSIDSAHARREVALREQRMRTITEQLYLAAGDAVQAQVIPPRLRDIQARLAANTLMLEYYCDGETIVVYCVNAESIRVYRLPITLSEVQQRIRQLQLNLAAALKLGPEAASKPSMLAIMQRVLQQLFTNLLGPCQALIARYHQLVIVPFGMLHYVPFHLLHATSGYLFEQHEVVVLPAASLLLRQPITRPAGALALAYSWEQRLPGTHNEAQLVQQLFGGTVLQEGAAIRKALHSAPVQILHIATHGEHRLDRPDLSYLQLADGQMYTDDLFQHDLSYELVTLSGCETGRATSVGGDELIGLGRGFLYTGAASLITSLWRVGDESTTSLMSDLYQSLRAGASKAAALRAAQVRALQHSAGLHPAFWGAFQLIGHAGPLSQPAAYS